MDIFSIVGHYILDFCLNDFVQINKKEFDMSIIGSQFWIWFHLALFSLICCFFFFH